MPTHCTQLISYFNHCNSSIHQSAMNSCFNHPSPHCCCQCDIELSSIHPCTNCKLLSCLLCLLSLYLLLLFVDATAEWITTLTLNSMKLVIPLYFNSWKKTPNYAVTSQRQSQFTPKMKANAEPRVLSSLLWIDSGVVVSQHCLESFFMK